MRILDNCSEIIDAKITCKSENPAVMAEAEPEADISPEHVFISP